MTSPNRCLIEYRYMFVCLFSAVHIPNRNMPEYICSPPNAASYGGTSGCFSIFTNHRIVVVVVVVIP